MSWTSRAEVLADTSELAADATAMAGSCRAAGLDPRSFHGIIGAAVALGAYPINATGIPWASDKDLIIAICDLLDLIADKWRAYQRLRYAVANRRAWARACYQGAPDDPGAGFYLKVVADCNTALETLESLPGRLRAASARLNAAPEQIGETYAAVYQLIAAGRRMPVNGRWITGEDLSR